MKHSTFSRLPTRALQMLTWALIAIFAAPILAQDSIDFNNDIRPILADTCYKCHGPDEHERKADLRLDTKPGLMDHAVEPNDLDASELYQRIITDDEYSLMPPPDSGRVLTDKQKDLVKRWIEQGAQWKNHWSLESPTKPNVPAVEARFAKPNWPNNSIDNFVLRRLAKEKLTPSEPADRATLIRRVAFDLTGLPPDTDLVKKYIDSTESDWYETLVDELLDSPRFGEHLGRHWLDAAQRSTVTCHSAILQSNNLPVTCSKNQLKINWSPRASTAPTSQPTKAARSPKKSTSATLLIVSRQLALCSWA